MTQPTDCYDCGHAAVHHPEGCCNQQGCDCGLYTPVELPPKYHAYAGDRGLANLLYTIDRMDEAALDQQLTELREYPGAHATIVKRWIYERLCRLQGLDP